MKPIQDPRLLVGTAIAGDDEELTGGHLLTRLVLDSETVAVYAIAPRNRPYDEIDVLRLEKPVQYLSMSVLHHSFTIATERYPQHPLILDSEVRMRRLEQEMTLRAEDSSFEEGVPFSQRLKDTGLYVLASEMGQLESLEDFRPSDLFEHRTIAGRIDGHLQARLQEILKDQSEDSDAYGALQRLAELIPVGIREQQRLGTYFPYSANPLCNLLLLCVQDFINREELLEICQGTAIEDHVTPRGEDRFISFCSLIYNHARHLRSLAEGDNSTGEDEPKTEASEDDLRQILQVYALVLVGTEMAEIFAERLEPEGGTLHGRTFLLRGVLKSELPPLREEAVGDLQRALEFFTVPEDLEFSHKAHACLAALLEDRDHDEAMKHFEAAYHIGQQLNLFENSDDDGDD